jgi:hypothetical protein
LYEKEEGIRRSFLSSTNVSVPSQQLLNSDHGHQSSKSLSSAISQEDLLQDEEEFKGALKVTRIRNRRYVRMPNFPKIAVAILKAWLIQHMDNPYPS